MGSSPLTRGKRENLSGPQHCAGIIPAHAGKTRQLGPIAGASRDHPRSRGENPRSISSNGSQVGSSPLTRGKLLDSSIGLALQRIIPAHAGKTLSRGRPIASPGDHPRSRGENNLLFNCYAAIQGSSPLTRGKRTGAQVNIGGKGIIPAHAGKTPSRGRAHGWLGDHPRSRGENRPAKNTSLLPAGSSPLTRGKQPLG